MPLLPKTAIISYDLKNAKDDDNQKVKHALTQLTNTRTTPQDSENGMFSSLSSLLNNIQLPDTTLLWNIGYHTISAKQIAEEVAHVIRQQRAEVGKIYVAFLSMSDDWRINE